jgi:hypothetical protein
VQVPLHAVAPVAFEDVPAGQRLHPEAPCSLLNVPGGQGPLHDGSASEDLMPNKPGAHALHNDSEPATL